jgi:trehalose 6-phosphate synthase/phosphatase
MAPRASGKLVVVANRSPYRATSARGRRRLVRAAGGLVTALDPVLRNQGGLWVSAQDTDHPMVVDAPEDIGYALQQVALPRAVQQGFYGSFSNAVLWPLLHSFPATIRIGEAPWDAYVAANQAFADCAIRHGGARDRYWIQDYHLMLMPRMLRQRRPRSRISWFCHIPWPSQDLFRILPWRYELLEGLLAADVLTFHTGSYARNFLRCVEFLTDYPVDHSAMTVQTDRGLVRIKCEPIGVPVGEIQTLAGDPMVLGFVEKLKESIGHRRIILGVDRLDYTKGIEERILAYERFLRQNRATRNQFVLVQVMVPSRTDVEAYRTLKDEIDRMVGDINGRFGATGRVPIHYLFQGLSQHQLLAHYRAADVALVTPLRDGMNLVAQEYAAAHIDGDGVLILSEFAGSAEYLTSALLVNPYDIVTLSDTIREAVEMPEKERRRRMQSIRAEVHKLDVHLWAEHCLRALDEAR